MDKYRVKISHKAIRYLDNIYAYIAYEKSAVENAGGQVTNREDKRCDSDLVLTYITEK